MFVGQIVVMTNYNDPRHVHSSLYIWPLVTYTKMILQLTLTSPSWFTYTGFCRKETIKHNVVVVMLFYVHGKHLRSCRDGQLKSYTLFGDIK